MAHHLTVLSMDPKQRIVRRLPLSELWVGSRLISTIKCQDLDSGAIVELLRTQPIRFVVADVGKPLEWIPNNETYDFWKTEARDHLAKQDEPNPLETFPGGYCYFASEWNAYEGNKIILLSKAH